MKDKRMFGRFEAAFDVMYLGAVLVMACVYAASSRIDGHWLFAALALVLVLGDAFHLVPRVATILNGEPDRYAHALGRGKMVASITMTAFYVLLMQIGVTRFRPTHASAWMIAACVLAAVRILLCLCPQNRWAEGDASGAWNLYRNIPFALLGLVACIFFFVHGSAGDALRWMWLAIALSFACYLPVVAGGKRHPMLGMLMLPKSCAYVWMIWMGLSGGV